MTDHETDTDQLQLDTDTTEMPDPEGTLRCPRCHCVPATDLETHWRRDCPPGGFDQPTSVRIPASAATVLAEEYPAIGAGVRAALRDGIPTEGDGSSPDQVTVACSNLTEATVGLLDRAVEGGYYPTKSHAIRAAVREHVAQLEPLSDDTDATEDRP